MCALNYKRFYHIAEFIHRNLPFVGWIVFMGMEDTGWATKKQKTCLDRAVGIPTRAASSRQVSGRLELQGEHLQCAFMSVTQVSA